MIHTFQDKYSSITLSPLLKENIEAMRTLRNKHRHNFVYSEIIDFETQKQWYINYTKRKDDYVFSVFFNNLWIGSVSIYNVKNDEAEFGRLLIDNDLDIPKGLGLPTTLCACKIAFTQMNLRKLYLQVYEDNIPAYKTYLKAGFVQSDIAFDKDGNKLINMYMDHRVIEETKCSN